MNTSYIIRKKKKADAVWQHQHQASKQGSKQTNMDDNTFAEEPTLASEDFFFPESDEDEEEEEYSYHLNRPHAHQRQRQHNYNKNNMMHTGSKAIDEIFAGCNSNGGGGEFGLLHYITTSRAEEEEENSRRGGGGGARDLSLAILAAHLLRAPDSTAMVIEWTLSSASSLDVRRLQRILQVSDSSRGEGDGGGASERIMEVLGRLNISKVFDAVGLDEALVELDGTLDPAREHQEVQRQQQQQQSVMSKGSNTVAAAAAQEGNKTATIGDSEEDDDEDDLEEEEKPEKDKAKEAPISTASKSPPATLLLINSISQILTPIIRNNYIQGQALLTSLMRSIADLTKRHQLFTIVLGEAGFRSVAEDETLSAFKSCVMKPAVGYGIGFLVDVHFYLHRPFVGADSQKKMMIKKKGEGPAGAQSQDRNAVSVLEIVEDRRGDRYQSYAPFDFTPDGQLQDVLQDS